MSHPVAVPIPVREPVGARSPWPSFWIASLAVLLVSIDATVLYAAFGALRRAFAGESAASLSWVLNAYTVTYAAMLVPAGGLADAHGRKRTFLVGASLFIIASFACGAAPSIELLIAARVVQAIGAALLTPASLSLILEAFPKEKRAVAVSLWGAVGGLAAAIGPSLGAWIVDTLGWPWAFYINLPLGAVSVFKGISVLRESRGQGRSPHVDVVGMLLLIVSVGGLALAITQWESRQWNSGELRLVLLGAGLSLAAFIMWSGWTRHPLFRLELFRSPTYSLVNVATLSFAIAFAMMFFAFFSYMTSIWKFSLPLAGIAITPGPLMVVPVAIASGKVAARIGHRPGLVLGSLVYACSGLWLAMVPGTEPAYWTQWFPGLMLSGAGVGMVLPSLSGAAVARLPQDQYAVGAAINQAIRQIGSVLGVAVTILLIGHDHLSRIDFKPLYLMHVGLALLTGGLCLGVNTRPRAAQG
ncbi:MFS transporter [Noviherbaspirillum galbum]|uniref:MFS transporter n=1 Tax=Noviherbaspirillum galbum TaxID=2709383 RepID=A0A6B3SG13_9BURK|nr:MFS transporter [Noviherbaspirillum galbum]NEX59533.1 MFS transporter [Noviherbaspirillum galbum]